MVGAPVDPVHDGERGAVQLVVEATRDQPAEPRLVSALLGQRLVHALDDVAALAHLAQRRLGGVADRPLRPGTIWLATPSASSLRRRPTLEDMELVQLPALHRRQIDDAGVARIPHELAVELRPAFRLDLGGQRATDVEIGARPQLLGDEVACPVAHPLLDVVA